MANDDTSYNDDLSDLNETDIEAPGGTQATHPAIRWVRDRDFSQLSDFPNDLTEEIRQHPIRSLALAFGAGYLLSKIID